MRPKPLHKWTRTWQMIWWLTSHHRPTHEWLLSRSEAAFHRHNEPPDALRRRGLL